MHPRVKYIVDIINNWNQLEDPSLYREDWMLLVQDPEIKSGLGIHIPMCESRGFISWWPGGLRRLKIYISDTPNIRTALLFEDVEGYI